MSWSILRNRTPLPYLLGVCSSARQWECIKLVLAHISGLLILLWQRNIYILQYANEKYNFNLACLTVISLLG